MKTVRLFLILASLTASIVSFAGRKLSADFTPGFSQHFKFEPSKEIALDAAVGWVRFEGLKIEAKQKKAGLLVKTIVLVHSKADDDIEAVLRVKFLDKDGHSLGTATGKCEIEDGDDGTLEAEVLLPASASEVEGYTLELAVPDED